MKYSSNTPSISVTLAGNPRSNTTHTYTIIVIDSNGCENSDFVYVKVYSDPTAMATTINISYGVDNGVLDLVSQTT